MAGLRSSLDLFDNVDFNSLIKKRKSLTNYLEYLIKNTKNNCKIITQVQISIELRSYQL